MHGSGLKGSATVEVRNKLRLLNILVSFILFLLLFIIVRYLESPLKNFLRFLPDLSMIVIMLIVFVLAGVGFYISRLLSGQVIRRIEDYSERLDSLLNLTKDIREELYGDILLEKIMDCSLDITRSDAGSILLIDDDNLVFKVVKGPKAEGLTGKSVSKEIGVSGWVLKNNQPVTISDATKDERFNPHIDELTGYRTNTMLCVPLKTKTATIGVIEVLNKKHGRYDERDIEIISHLADQAAISIERAQFYEDQRNYEIHLTDILLDTIDRFIPEKQGHSRRVAKYANVIAKAIGMSDKRKRRLYFASLLHDIGFLRLPVEKSFQKEVYTMHPEVGYEMLKPITFYKDIAQYVLHHHERYDGFGYPTKLKGDNIPLESRIIAIAEAFDSMVNEASYRITVDTDAGVEEILRYKGAQFDPELADVFAENIKGSE
ncbi:MAG: GAF domain-containing protein [Nitrospirae bacterium]|nr:GAF domain-containing protein [Nitrospirota bacterium]